MLLNITKLYLKYYIFFIIIFLIEWLLYIKKKVIKKSLKSTFSIHFKKMKLCIFFLFNDLIFLENLMDRDLLYNNGLLKIIPRGLIQNSLLFLHKFFNSSGSIIKSKNILSCWVVYVQYIRSLFIIKIEINIRYNKYNNLTFFKV